MIDSLPKGEESERVNFRFWFEASDFKVEFRSLFRSLYLFMIRLVDKFTLSFPFNPRSLYIVELSLAVLQSQSGSIATTTTNNKILLSAVCFSDPMSLIRKF